MKKLLSMILILALLLTTLSGCSNAIDNSAYVPTGNAIVLEGQEDDDFVLPPFFGGFIKDGFGDFGKEGNKK